MALPIPMKKRQVMIPPKERLLAILVMAIDHIEAPHVMEWL